MKNIKYTVLLFGVVFVSVFSIVQAQGKQISVRDFRIDPSNYNAINPLRVLFLGDSITQGGGDDSSLKYGGYRGFLQELLKQRNINFSVVGAFNDLYYGPLSPLSAFHSGIGGAGWSPQYSYSLGSIVDAWNLSKGLNPQLVFVSGGSNGLNLGESVEHNIQSAKVLINQMYADVPSVCVVLGSNIPVINNSILNNQITKFNRSLERDVYKVLYSEGKCIFWADLNNSINKALTQKKVVFGTDGVHPVKDGYATIANAWLAGSNIFK